MRKTVVSMLAGLSLAVVIMLWAGNGGVGEVVAGGWPAVVAIGRLTGLLASNLLLLQVLLMARIPLVERAFGQDRLARWHRWTGFSSFHLMLTHVVLITLGYAGPARTGALTEFWNLVTTYPGMMLAAAAVALLIMVVVTSVRRARRRFRYESWHLLHLYAYLGIGLALPHQLWTGADFIASPAARIYWQSLYAAAAGAVLVFRVGMPLWRSLRHRLEIDAVVPEGPNLTSVYIRGRRLDRLPVRAGQFFLWRFLDGPGRSRAHPFSLSGPPRADTLRITVKDVGDGTSRLAGLQPGTRVAIEGPFGRLTGQGYDGLPVTMFACGIGITPLLSLLWDLPYPHGNATLVYRTRFADELVFRSELDTLAARRGIRVVPLVGPRASGRSWLPQGYQDTDDISALHELEPDIEGHHVYICGPDEWAKAVREAALAARVPGRRIHTERFAW